MRNNLMTFNKYPEKHKSFRNKHVHMNEVF